MKKTCFTLAVSLIAVAFAQASQFVFDTPSDDRWQYPFNFGSGGELTAKSFSAVGQAGFVLNNRDGIVILAWDTTTLIPPGQGASSYDLRSVTVTVTSEPTATWPIDLTVDQWFQLDLNQDGIINPDGIPAAAPGDTDGESDDLDPGRPFELYGAGFGPTFTESSWTEFSAFVGARDQGVQDARDPFPFVFQQGTLDKLHVEDHADGLHNDMLPQPVFEFTPIPWAIGVPQNYTPSGGQPFDITFTVDLTTSDGAVRSYFQDQLNNGRLIVVLCSPHEAAPFGGNPGPYPSIFMKEAVGVDPAAKAPELVLSVFNGLGGDSDNDGDLDLVDWANFPACLTGPGGPMNGTACEVFDFAPADFGVDLGDFAAFQNGYTGAL